MTPSSTPSRQIAFTGKQQVELQPIDKPLPAKDEVLVRTDLSLMSTGTENIVFNRNFDPGTHWDNWVKYPFFPGYSAVGTIEATGGAVTDRKIGERVAIRRSHSSYHAVPAADCFPIPERVPFDQAVWFALAKIAFHGSLAADYRFADRVVIIGAGPIGQMSIRWARAAGATAIVAVDSATERMPMATSGGATSVISTPIQEAGPAIVDAMGGQDPTIIIDSTGNAEVFEAALKLVGRFGKVVILGDTGRPAQQKLTSDVITRGITIVGAHDMHNSSQWNNATIAELFFGLVATGRFGMDGLNTHVFKPEDCAKAYEAANRERFSTMGILFDWRP